jgi:RAT1-interacting protein
MASSAFASAFCPLSQSSTSTSLLGIQKPHLLTTYSHLPNRDIVHSNESMVYHSPAPIGVDLNYGFETKVERDPENDMEEHLDGLCQSLRRWVEGGGNLKSGSLITWRGMLTR